MTKKVVKIPTGPKPGAPAPLNQEERIAAMNRAFIQRFESIAQGVLYNLCNNPAVCSTAFNEPEQLVKTTIDITTAYFDKIGPAVDAAFDKMVNTAKENKPAE